MRLTTFALGSSAVTALTLSLVIGACSSDDGGGSSGVTPTPEAGNSDSPSGSDSGGNDGGGTDTGTDAPTGGLTGPYSLIYAGQIVGIDSRQVLDGKATFDGQKLTGYEADGRPDEKPKVGTNTVQNVAGGTGYVMGRWAGGVAAGTSTDTYAANGGFQYVIGQGADPIPSTGATVLTLANKTVATVSDGTLAPGTVSGTAATVYSGATTKIALSLSLDVPGDTTYTFETTGGVADPSQSDAQLADPAFDKTKGGFFVNRNVTPVGAACPGGGSCSVAIRGFVGKNGDFVAVVMHVYQGSGGSPKSVTGAIVFKK